MEDNKKESPDQKPPFSDTGYVGNVWGWKFSYLSLVIILVTLAAVLARYCYVKTHYPERFHESNRDTTMIINPMPE